MFSPPLHRQRHQFVIDFVNRNKPQKVADLGCSECTLLKKLKFYHDIELLVGVDINGGKIKKKMHGLAPLSTDYLQPSYDQLRIELYQGSVTQKDVRLRGFDLVTGIELIEHLTLADVERFSEVVFGYMSPAVVIISTPNVEFNSLLSGLTGFRHSDHKFEWTRAEFQSWALRECLKYGYEVEFTGVGPAPPGQQESIGFCSQIGVFHRLREGDDCRTSLGGEAEDVFSYELLYSINYPSLRDNNMLRRVLVAEVLYSAEELKRRWMEEKMAQRNDSLCQTEEGAEDCLRTEERIKAKEKHTACGPEMKNLMEWYGESVSVNQERDAKELVGPKHGGQLESLTVQRHVSIPLALLWSCFPKVSALSGSLSNLRHFLLEDPAVKLSQDGSAVLLKEKDLEEEDYMDSEDSGYGETKQRSHRAEQEEEWEASL